MAEPASTTASADDSALAIKQDSAIEQENASTGFEEFDFTLPPELSSKRPLEDFDTIGQLPDVKRARTDSEMEVSEAHLEDGLNALVDGALSNAGKYDERFESGDDDAVAQRPDSSESDKTMASIPTFAEDPVAHIRALNLYALGSLSVSILMILVQQPLRDTINLIRGTDSAHAKSFQGLKASFEAVWRLYTSNSVLSADGLAALDADSRAFLDFANLAKLGCLLIDGSPHALSEASDNFFELTQCGGSDWPPVKIELFSNIVYHEPDRTSDEALAAAKEKHLEDRLRSFVQYLTPKLKSSVDLGAKLGIDIQVEEVEGSAHLAEPEPEPEPLPNAQDAGGADIDMDDEFLANFEKSADDLVQSFLDARPDENTTEVSASGDNSSTKTAKTDAKPGGTTTQSVGKDTTDYKELEALVAESTSNYVKTTLSDLSPFAYQPTVPTGTAESMTARLPYFTQTQQASARFPYFTHTEQQSGPPQAPVPGGHLPPNQTFPSAILYDKARQAALSKSSAHTRREGLHSARRPWTQDEEKALMAGLDMVKGPHWSQILTLFGQHGTVSDILRDRTQVQLKDKARNLKLFFLKTNSEMPYYLQAVTGELKTRAPQQAARKEAEEKRRLTSEEDQAKLEGIMALAGGLQHPPPGPAPAAAAKSNVVTPAPSTSPAPVASSSVQPAVGQQAKASVTGGLASIPRPTATPASQNRPSVQTTTQHLLHAVAQGHQRPQAQLPPQVPRPQGPQRQQQPQQSEQQPNGASAPQPLQKPAQHPFQQQAQPHERQQPNGASAPQPLQKPAQHPSQQHAQPHEQQQPNGASAPQPLQKPAQHQPAQPPSQQSATNGQAPSSPAVTVGSSSSPPVTTKASPLQQQQQSPAVTVGSSSSPPVPTKASPLQQQQQSPAPASPAAPLKPAQPIPTPAGLAVPQTN